jgi:hypothetical protein
MTTDIASQLAQAIAPLINSSSNRTDAAKQLLAIAAITWIRARVETGNEVMMASEFVDDAVDAFEDMAEVVSRMRPNVTLVGPEAKGSA